MAHRDTRVECGAASTEAVGGIYEAALDPAAWPRALGLIARHVGARSAAAFAIDLKDFTIGFRAAAGMEPAALDDYALTWARRDPLLGHAATQPAGQPFLTEEFMTDGEWRGSEFHHEFLGKHGLSHAMGGLAARSGAVALACFAFRPEGADEFGAAERKGMAEIFRHLARAARIRRRLAKADGIADGLSQAMARMPLAAMLCDAGGRALWLNPQAEEMARRREGLRLNDGRVEAANGMGAQLRLMMAGGAAATGNGKANGQHALDGNGQGDGWLQLARPWPRKPLILQVVPLLPGEPWPDPVLGEARPAALLLISDPERTVRVPADQLARALGLTAAEARLAAALAAGANLADYAARARITVGTARWYLKQALAKTGNHRQSELVREVMETVGGTERAREMALPHLIADQERLADSKAPTK